jgi:hypothetical protein
VRYTELAPRGPASGWDDHCKILLAATPLVVRSARLVLVLQVGSVDRASSPLKPALVDDLLDVLRWSYDGVDHVVVDGIRETMLDSAKSDHPLAAMGEVAQAPGDVVAALHLHSGLAEIDVAAVLQFKVHHVLHDPVKPLPGR